MGVRASDIRNAFKYFFPEEFDYLRDITLELPDTPIIVNIGAGSGTSGLLFKETRPDCILHTIDIQDLSSPFGCLEAERDVMSRAGLGDHFGNTWFQECGDSKQIAPAWSERGMAGMVDLLFIDGDHSYEGCKGDLTLWIPMVSKGGLVAVHDYKKGEIPPDPNGPHPMEWPGVDRAVDEELSGVHELVGRVDSLVVYRIVSPEEDLTDESTHVPNSGDG